MLSQISDYISQNELVKEGDRIVVGVSGGADSVFLLHILNQLYSKKNVELIVVHINHGVRGEEAKRDEQYVKGLSDSLELPFYSFHYNVPQISKEQGISEEEAGRLVRYQSFYQICKEYGCNKIAIAHNKNDNAETVLFHLFRGSGIKGLSGIRPKRRIVLEDNLSVDLIRPILFLERKVIEEYLESNQIEYCTDYTNLENIYQRNKIRNQLFPFVEREINRNAMEHVVATASSLSEIQEYIQKQTKKCFDDIVQSSSEGTEYRIPLLALQKVETVIQKELILMVFEHLIENRKDMEAKHVSQVLSLLQMQVGKQIHLPYGLRVNREYDAILFSRKNHQKKDKKKQDLSIEIVIPGKTHLHGMGFAIETLVIPNDGGPIPKNSCTKWFDYDKIMKAVTIRTRKEGDFLEINECGGKKKLKDYFIDHKIPREDRDSILLIADGSHIMWILKDNRMSEKYKVREETKNILVMNIIAED